MLTIMAATRFFYGIFALLSYQLVFWTERRVGVMSFLGIFLCAASLTVLLTRDLNELSGVTETVINSAQEVGTCVAMRVIELAQYAPEMFKAWRDEL